MGDHESDGYTVDEALSSVGFGAFQGLALVFAGIGFFSGAMEITLLSFIGPALESEWSLSPTEESLLSTAVFGGMSVGSYFLGFIADAYGRRMGNRGVAMITFAVGLLSAFSPDYKSLIVLRFLVGFGAAGGHVYSAWFLEFIPTSNRGAWMSVMSFSWIIGELLEASLAWIIMPRWGWRWLLALTSVPSLAVLLLSNFAPETPRYLAIKGRTNEAVRVLERVALINQRELPAGCLVSDHQTMHPDEENSPSEETCLLPSSRSKRRGVEKWLRSLSELFSSDLLWTTLLSWILFIAYTFAYYGIQLMISALSSDQSDCRSLSILPKNVDKGSLYVNVFISYFSRTSSSAFGYASRGTVRPEVLRANPDYASSCLHPTVAFASERNRDYSFISQQPHVPLCRVHHFRPLRKRGLSNFCEGRRLRASERDRENWRNDMPSGGSGAGEGLPSNTRSCIVWDCYTYFWNCSPVLPFRDQG